MGGRGELKQSKISGTLRNWRSIVSRQWRLVKIAQRNNHLKWRDPVLQEDCFRTSNSASLAVG